MFLDLPGAEARVIIGEHLARSAELHSRIFPPRPLLSEAGLTPLGEHLAARAEFAERVFAERDAEGGVSR